MAITHKTVGKPKSKETVQVVYLDGEPLGLPTKFRDDRWTKNPWKAWRGIGCNTRFVQSFYPEEGGKIAALRCVRLAYQQAWDRPGARTRETSHVSRFFGVWGDQSLFLSGDVACTFTRIFRARKR